MMEQYEFGSNATPYELACAINECVVFINQLERRIQTLKNMHDDKSEVKNAD